MDKQQKQAEQKERQQRRKAIRLHLKGMRPRDTLKRIPRSRQWLYKWIERFEQEGWAGLKSKSRSPQHPYRLYGSKTVRVVVGIRRSLKKRKLGLVGAKAIQAEIEREGLLAQVPSIATIERILKAAGETAAPTATPKQKVYYPKPQPNANYSLQAFDWISRRIAGGAYVFAFNLIDYASRDLVSMIADNKRAATARDILVCAWRKIGLPDALQLDNDAAFCGGYNAAHVFGQVVRLCLYCGIEPIFIPVGEAKRNGLVERINQLWHQAFWKRRHFRNVKHAQRCNPAFEHWYYHEYKPPPLNGLTLAEFKPQTKPTKLLARQARHIPAKLPITAGRIHFVRYVDTAGEVRILNEVWHVDKRLAGKYIWATIVTHEKQLYFYYRRSEKHTVRLLKKVPYYIEEPVVSLLSQYRRRPRRRKMSTLL